MKIDKKIIKELSDYLDEFNLTEIEYSENNVKYKVSKSSKGVVREQIVSTDNQSKPSSAASTITSENINKANIIKSPMVGTAYLAPEPGAKPFVTIGANIKKGQTIIIIEAMKTMNHVPSTKD
ncbi:MAG: acetyl-CoA carboxylase biotin carboxyl carrier protein subunit, partial [Proteobacteria bacterium]|nr:acetyl-CoA carboxylase biotin carboxyl carrier protein subunit [Pseudomonadota bacterium]